MTRVERQLLFALARLALITDPCLIECYQERIEKLRRLLRDAESVPSDPNDDRRMGKPREYDRGNCCGKDPCVYLGQATRAGGTDDGRDIQTPSLGADDHKWRVVQSAGVEHVMPIADLREHVAILDCWCGPTDDDGVLVHHSMDRREEYEQGKPKS